MPQIVLEYSSNIKDEIDFTGLFANIHRIINTTGGVKIENCKSRSTYREDYYIGRGEQKSAFVHLEVQWLEGRTANLKSLLGKELLALLVDFYQSTARELDVQITIHIVDIARDSYFKYPGGTFTVL